MRFHEIIKESAPRVDDEPQSGFYQPEDDDINHQNIDDTRKPALTLRMVNRLKKIRSTKNLEMAKKQELLGIMYGQGQGEDEEL